MWAFWAHNLVHLLILQWIQEFLGAHNWNAPGVKFENCCYNKEVNFALLVWVILFLKCKSFLYFYKSKFFLFYFAIVSQKSDSRPKFKVKNSN